MKIAIPVDDNKKDVCVSFGRTPYFLFCDTETGKSEVDINPAADAEGGAGLKSAQFVVDHEPDVLITVRCGENAAEVLLAADMKIYKAQGTDAEENIKLLQEGKLDILDHFHAGFHGKV